MEQFNKFRRKYVVIHVYHMHFVATDAIVMRRISFASSIFMLTRNPVTYLQTYLQKFVIGRYLQCLLSELNYSCTILSCTYTLYAAKYHKNSNSKNNRKL